MIVFLIFVILIVVLWWGVQMHNEVSLENLEESGFEIDYKLEGSTQLVFDEDRKKLAFVKLDKVLVYDYDQVLRWELERVRQSGWSNKSESVDQYQITFYMKDLQDPIIQVRLNDLAEVGHWQERLNQLLAGPTRR